MNFCPVYWGAKTQPPTGNTIDHEAGLKVLSAYIKGKRWTRMSFDKIKSDVHPDFTEEYVMKLVEIYPEKIRRCRLRNGSSGVKLLSGEE